MKKAFNVATLGAFSDNGPLGNKNQAQPERRSLGDVEKTMDAGSALGEKNFDKFFRSEKYGNVMQDIKNFSKPTDVRSESASRASEQGEKLKREGVLKNLTPETRMALERQNSEDISRSLAAGQMAKIQMKKAAANAGLHSSMSGSAIAMHATQPPAPTPQPGLLGRILG